MLIDILRESTKSKLRTLMWLCNVCLGFLFHFRIYVYYDRSNQSEIDGSQEQCICKCQNIISICHIFVRLFLAVIVITFYELNRLFYNTLYTVTYF